ncbi:MAG: hypothetical protein ACRD13_13405, partial [Terriglobales bacterium]
MSAGVVPARSDGQDLAGETRLLKKEIGTATRPATVWERGLPARPRPRNAAYGPQYWCEAQ